MNVPYSHQKVSRLRRLGRAAAAAAIAAMMIAAMPHAGAAPAEFQYQGLLTRASGAPLLSNDVTVTVDIYNVASSGSPLETVSYPNLDLAATKGMVNLTIPAGTLDLSGDLYLEITISDNVSATAETLAPRQKLVSVPFALDANSVGGNDFADIQADAQGRVDTAFANAVQLTGDQTAAGVKTWSNNANFELSNISASASGETGAGISLRATADPAAQRSIGIRSRVLLNSVAPDDRAVQAFVGSAQSAGGASTTINGAFFGAKVLSGATAGIETASGMGAEVVVEPGATGFNDTQNLVGGFFTVFADNSGDANALGSFASATGVHSGASVGFMGVAAGSTTSNAGVIGAANATLASLTALSVPAEGVGVVAVNPVPAGYALWAEGATMLNGNATVAGTVSASDPVAASDLATKQYVDGLAFGGSGFVDLTSAQTIGGIKTFTSRMENNVANISTSTSGESGAGISVRGTVDPAAERSIAIRGRLSDNASTANSRMIQAVVGATNSTGGTNTTVNGAYFNSNIVASATAGAELVTGVGADAEAAAGASGFTSDQALLGGRFSAQAGNAGDAAGVGVFGTATGVHAGRHAGVIGIASQSLTSNVGVFGSANTTLADLTSLTATPEGVGVFAHNAVPGGLAFYASGNSEFDGDVAVMGSLTASTPTAANEVATKGYVDGLAFGGSGFVDLTSNQNIGGTKTFTGRLNANLSNINTSTSGEVGAGVSIRSEADPAAERATGFRSRILADSVEAQARQVQGISGNGNSAGGPNTTITGGYFNGKATANATQGALLISGVSADAEADPGAAGFTAGQTLLGGRFGAQGDNAGDAASVGLFASGTGVHSGRNAGLVAVAAQSTTSNVGIFGGANITLADLAAITATPEGIGIYAYNSTAGGLALKVQGPTEADGRVSLKDVLNLDPVATLPDPAGSVRGDVVLFDNAGTLELRVFDGAAWVNL